MSSAPAPNAFGLTQCVLICNVNLVSTSQLSFRVPTYVLLCHRYDGLTSFFGSQSFDYNGFILPPVALQPIFP